jgi:hypothetical protein
MSNQDNRWPSPLRDQADEVGSALRQYQQTTSEASGETAAYARVVARLEPSRARWRLPIAALVVTVPALVWLVWTAERTPTAPSAMPTTSAVAPVPALLPVGPPASPNSDEDTLRLGLAPAPLPKGKLSLPGGVTGDLGEDGAATARLENGTLDIALLAGRIDLHVPRREIGQAVLVNVDSTRFTVVGTKLWVGRQPHRIDLRVGEGLVTVSRHGQHLATVASGETWSGSLLPPVPPRNDRAPRIASRHPPQDCAKLTAEQTKEKVACYREKVRQGGPEGERAQHALARYLRDDVVDLTAALSEFESQRVHFPRGQLRSDADRAIIELLPRLGRHAEALVETQSFLDADPNGPDRAEIRLLRGDIFRAIFGDLTSAEREYDEGAMANGRTGDDSRFLRALCLEALGRTDEARLAYRDYLSQSGAAHASEAKRHMDRLPR